jgi:lipopolysaccharide/colanic/teichoic acid biosynthesis glycosyltransferase
VSTNHEAMDDALLLALIEVHLELDDDSRLSPREPREVDPAGLIARFHERVAREEAQAQMLLAHSIEAALTMGDDERFAAGSPSVGEVAHARAAAWTVPAAAPAGAGGDDAGSVGRPSARLFDVAAMLELASSGLRRAVGRSDAPPLPTRYLLPAAPRVRAVETTPSLGPPELAAVWDWQSSIASLRPDSIQLSLAAPPRLHVDESGHLRWQDDGRVAGSLKPAPAGNKPAPSQQEPRVLNDPSQGEQGSATYRVRRRIKSIFDFVAAALTLVVLSPLLLLTAIVIRVTSRGPALFTQPRVGHNGKVFRIIKFRTMYQNAEWRLAESLDNHDLERGVLRKMATDPRLTPVGRLLRRFSINEFPQLINVLNGSMSIVGPRPPLPNEACRYGQTLRRRLRVKPGLTGLWQISGRGDLCWEEAVLFDLRYIDEWSLRLDAKIIWNTFRALKTGAH